MQALLEMENSGLVALLRDDKYEDLARLYSLMRRVDTGLPTVGVRQYGSTGGGCSGRWAWTPRTNGEGGRPAGRSAFPQVWKQQRKGWVRAMTQFYRSKARRRHMGDLWPMGADAAGPLKHRAIRGP